MLGGFHQRGREWNDIENDERAHGWAYVVEDIPLDEPEADDEWDDATDADPFTTDEWEDDEW